MAADRDDERRRPGALVRGLLPRRVGSVVEAADPAAPVPGVEQARDLESVIGDCALYEEGGRRTGRLPLREARAAARSTSGFVWIGLQQPTAAEVEAIAQEFALPPLAVEDAVKAHQRPKLETYGAVLFAVLKPVRYVDHDEVVEIAEIAVFVGPNFVVTVRHGESDVLRRVRAELDSGQSSLPAQGTTGLLHRTLDLVVDGYEETLGFIDEDVDQIESQVFSAATDDNSERIYKLKREIAEFRRAVLPLSSAVQRLAAGEIVGIDQDSLPYFRDVHDHVLRTADGIEVHDRLLSDILQADLARVAVRQSEIAVRQNEIAVRQNEDMRKISAWAAIALVPTAIAGIYGMNFENMPELHWKYGYFVVVAGIVTACVVLHRLFRRNGWL
jgi:magnesium transporter